MENIKQKQPTEYDIKSIVMETIGINQESCGNIISQIKMNITKKSVLNKRSHPFDINSLWSMFKVEFEKMFGTEFLVDDIVRNNILPVFYYFMESELFFECENLMGNEISAPSFQKGLLLFGNVGVGKTNIMHVFERIFSNYLPHRFKIIPTYKVVDQYEDIVTREDRRYFYDYYQKGNILFDDLNSEKTANNFGHLNIMKEVFKRRYDANKKTHLILNPLVDFENDVMGSLEKLGETYDKRNIDRWYSMFNVVVFNGKSMRR